MVLSHRSMMHVGALSLERWRFAQNRGFREKAIHSGVLYSTSRVTRFRDNATEDAPFLDSLISREITKEEIHECLRGIEGDIGSCSFLDIFPQVAAETGSAELFQANHLPEICGFEN